MLLNHLRQRRRSVSRDVPVTALNRTQPIQDQNRTTIRRGSSPNIERLDSLENVTEIDSTLHGFTYYTDAHEETCMVVGHGIGRPSTTKPDARPQRLTQTQTQKKNSARPVSKQSRPLRRASQDIKSEVKPVLGLPLDNTAIFEYRFSPFHNETAITIPRENPTLSAEVPRSKGTVPSEEDRQSRAGRIAKEKKLGRNERSGAEIDVEILKLNKPSYQALEGNVIKLNRTIQESLGTTGRAENGFYPMRERSSVSPNTDHLYLSPESKQTSPGKHEGNVSPFEGESLPKEGSLLKYFRAQAARPKSSANYRQVIQAKQAMYESLALEEDSPVKGKRGGMTGYMAMTKTDFRRGKDCKGRRTISCDNTVVNTSIIETNLVAEMNKSTKAPSSIDVFSEKIKKFIETKNEEPDTVITNLDDESFLQSFLKTEYSAIAKLREQNEGRRFHHTQSLDSTINPFNTDDPSPPTKAEQQRGIGPRTRKRAVANYRRSSDGSNKSAETDENTRVNTMDELVTYVKQRNTFVEESIRKVDEERDRKKWNGRLIDTVIAKMKERGGVSQTLVRSNYGISTKFERDIEEIKEVRNDIGDVKRELQFVHLSKEEAYKEKRELLEKAKFVSPNRLTNSELEFVRDQFLNRRPEDMHMDKIDELLKRLKFFAQLSRGVRISFYNCAKYVKEQKGHYIFHQGDIGDLMYIILRGSVSVKVPKRLKDGRCQFVTIASLYDGSHFGELAIMAVKQKPKVIEEEKPAAKPKSKESIRSKKTLEIKGPKPEVKEAPPAEAKPQGEAAPQQKRSASIQCAEETEMLTMSRDKFQEILLLVMNTDMDTKIRLLQLTNFYRRESNFTLMPVANNMKAMKFKLGQKVIQTGDILMNFYIIAKGTCKVIQEVEEEYDYDASIYGGKLKPLISKDFTDIPGKLDQAEVDRQNEKKILYSTNPLLRTFDASLPPKTKENENIQTRGQRFIKHVVFKEMGVGDFFGFRPLLRPESDAKYKQLKESRAKLTVVAYSTNVEIFALPRASLLYLPERVKSMLLDGISQLTDFDQVDINKPVQEQKAWRDYQLKLVEDTLVKPEHPNLRRPRDSYKAK